LPVITDKFACILFGGQQFKVVHRIKLLLGCQKGRRPVGCVGFARRSGEYCTIGKVFRSYGGSIDQNSALSPMGRKQCPLSAVHVVGFNNQNEGAKRTLLKTGSNARFGSSPVVTQQFGLVGSASSTGQTGGKS
jgi:hypothetical protein